MARLILILGILISGIALVSVSLLELTQSQTSSVYLHDISTEMAGTVALPAAESLRVHIAKKGESNSLTADRLPATVAIARADGSRVACRIARRDVPYCGDHRQG